jgi:hypothetical protein
MLKMVMALLPGSAIVQTPRPPKPGVKTPGVKIPIERLQPEAVFPYTVAQQFTGKGGDAVRVGLGSIWLSNLEAGNVWRIDPRRVLATLPQ